MLLRKCSAIFIVLSAFSLSCVYSPSRVGCPPLPPVSDLPKSHVVGVNAFLDASGSMKGFMFNNSDFQYLVPDLLGRLQRDFPVVHFFALSQKGQAIQSFDVDPARKAIAYGNFQFGDASTLPAMFDSAIGHLTPGTISLLITDGIYTPPAENSKLKYQESTDITDVLSKASRKGMSAACLAFHSSFSKAGNPAIVSPYYIFVLGNPQDITAFKEELNNSIAAISSHLANKDLNEQDFGYPARNIFYSIIPYADNTGAGEPANCPELDNRFLVVSHIDLRKDPQFWIGLDLSGAPSYIDQDDYLKKNLVITGTGLNATVVGNILPVAGFTGRLTDETDKNLSGKCTHFVRIRVADLEGRDGEIGLSLKKVRPSWVETNNHDEAAVAEQRRDKTYGLKNIFDGMEDTYKERSASWFFKDLKIIVNKNRYYVEKSV
jgi:hypothetical protein